MEKSKQTKRALIPSLLAVILCVAMLVGTTFAWFTDTASTSVNKIEAGKLDVELYYANNTTGTEDGTTWTKITSETTALEFVKAADGTGQKVLWEPGCTYSLPALKIVNAGNLALKYKVVFTAVETTAENLELAKVLDVTMNGASAGTLYDVLTSTDADGYAYGKLAGNTETDPITLSVKMRETAGNEYQGLFIGGIAVTLLATQLESEYDSYNNSYDKNAQYPDVAYVKVDAAAEGDTDNPLATAITAAAEATETGEAKQEIVADLSAGIFTLTDKENEMKEATAGKSVTLAGDGAESTTFDVKKTNVGGEANATYCFDGAESVVFKDMTIEFDGAYNYQGFVRAEGLHFINCTIKGMGSNWGTGDVVFDNCSFVNAGADHEYNLWTYSGASFTFNDCTFTSSNGRFINVYRGGGDEVVDITLNNCKFENKADAAKKAAVLIKGEKVWNVVINGCTLTGSFTEIDDKATCAHADNGLWLIENPAGGNKITVDGTLKYPTT